MTRMGLSLSVAMAVVCSGDVTASPQGRQAATTTQIDTTPVAQAERVIDKAADAHKVVLSDDATKVLAVEVGSSRVDLQACKLEYSIVSPK